MYWRLFIMFHAFAVLEALLIYLTILGKEQGFASLLLLIGILAALLFSWIPALALEFSLLLVYLGINITLKGWNGQVVPSFVGGILVDIFIVATIGLLLYVEESRRKEKDLAALKDQFIANIHHELRTPLISLLLALDILRDDGHDMSDEEHATFLDQAVFAGNELQRIVDNVLDAVRADSDVSAPLIRVFELDRVVFDVLHHIDTSDHALHADIPEDIFVQGDPQQVGQVIRNLLSNCCKYVPKESQITVRIWRDDAFAYVCVKDRGPGIQTDHIPLVFQKFSRLERDRAGSVQGIGLGLYICRRLIENMGGRIWVESTGVAGEGSSFYFTLSIADASPISNCT